MSDRSRKGIERQIYKELQRSLTRIGSGKKEACGGSSVLASNVIRATLDMVRDILPSAEALQYEFVEKLHRKWHAKAKVTFDSPQCDMFASNAHLTIAPSEYVEFGKATTPQVRLAKTNLEESTARVVKQVNRKVAILDGVLMDAEKLQLTDATVEEILLRARGLRLVHVDVEPGGPEEGEEE